MVSLIVINFLTVQESHEDERFFVGVQKNVYWEVFRKWFPIKMRGVEVFRKKSRKSKSEFFQTGAPRWNLVSWERSGGIIPPVPGSDCCFRSMMPFSESRGAGIYLFRHSLSFCGFGLWFGGGLFVRNHYYNRKYDNNRNPWKGCKLSYETYHLLQFFHEVVFFVSQLLGFFSGAHIFRPANLNQRNVRILLADSRQNRVLSETRWQNWNKALQREWRKLKKIKQTIFTVLRKLPNNFYGSGVVDKVLCPNRIIFIITPKILKDFKISSKKVYYFILKLLNFLMNIFDGIPGVFHLDFQGHSIFHQSSHLIVFFLWHLLNSCQFGLQFAIGVVKASELSFILFHLEEIGTVHFHINIHQTPN